MTFPLIEPRLRRNLDRPLLLAMFLLMGLSIATVYFAKGFPAPAVRQGVYFIVGLVLMVYVAAQDYNKIARFANFLYWGNILVLIGVLFIPAVKGSSRWIPVPIPGMDLKLQPSEFVKVVIILTLSAYVVQMGGRIREFPYLLRSLAHIALPVGLIMKQPDLGTGLVVIAIWAGIVFLAGANWKHMVGLALVGSLLFGTLWVTGIGIKEYQKDRIRTFLNPASDPRGDGYHVLQSMTAIGGGQVTGQGLGQGIQTNGKFIPENHTDFVFTALGEEGGFVGACVLISVYGLFLWRGIAIIGESEDPLGRLIAGGVVTLFAFHITVNIGMTCGIMPVVGVPLPLMSFGGSAAWANLAAIGLLLSISMRRHKIQF